ncbi:Phosphoglycolate phosphatase [Streptomyces fumanus]
MTCPYGGPHTSRDSTSRASAGASASSAAIRVRSVNSPVSAATADTGSWVEGSPAAARISWRACYRSLYPEYAIAATPALTGAREAIEAVRRRGGRAIVVTAKYEPNAKLHLDHLGIEPDAVIGDLWAEQKAVALREHGAEVYVGDHLGDIRGARAAGAHSVAVATGPYTVDELRAAGADTVLTDLTEFPAWLADYREDSASRA